MIATYLVEQSGIPALVTPVNCTIVNNLTYPTTATPVEYLRLTYSLIFYSDSGTQEIPGEYEFQRTNYGNNFTAREFIQNINYYPTDKIIYYIEFTIKSVSITPSDYQNNIAGRNFRLMIVSENNNQFLFTQNETDKIKLPGVIKLNGSNLSSPIGLAKNAVLLGNFISLN